MKDQWYYWREKTLFLKVHVSPQSRRNAIGTVCGGRLRIKLNAPPVDGKANLQLIEVLAREFAVGKARIRIAMGTRGRDKLVTIDHPDRMPAWLASPQSDH